LTFPFLAESSIWHFSIRESTDYTWGRIFRIGKCYKVLTYIEYRAVSGVFRTFDPEPPLHQRGGGHTRRAVGGGEGSIFWKKPDIGLASYSIIPLRKSPSVGQCSAIKPHISSTHLQHKIPQTTFLSYQRYQDIPYIGTFQL
jgi:hypothetical protein